MKILVTGGAGYIGSVTAERLLDEGHVVTVFDNLERGHREALDPRARFIVGDLRVDLAGRHVFVGDKEVHLTPLEFKLLMVLIRYAGKVLTHQYLLKEVWGPHHTQDTHYLRVHMAQLRRKIEPDPAQPRYLLTETGVGYRFADQ